ncbi:MAG: hypothetical protein DRP47_08340 [Candidatus Zixiibacteriota bacterium]|nr:MAG: hypothetical protein DRP47_08340 [candidate division Zixibacteria bacterium]
MEFLLLLIVTLAIAIAVSIIVLAFFRKPVDKIFHRIIGEEIADAWRKFLTFALFVVGISSGVNIWKLEQFIQPASPDEKITELTAEYWGLEIYRTIIHTLGGLAWALLLFFVVALIAFVLVKRGEMKAAKG